MYKELGNSAGPSNNAPPNAEEAKEFWSKIWSVNKEHDKRASWLHSVKQEIKGVEQQRNVVLDGKDVKVGIQKMANWKAPGPDGVRGFWFKKFGSLHKAITSSLQACLEGGVVPEWMVKGRTVLIQKDAKKGTIVSNYRPIACLPLMWKLLTGIFAEKIYDHLLDNNLLPDEQKGCRKRSRGTKDQLLIDKEILKEARVKKRCLSMAWIDYRKAYDMVPHSWILEMLSMTKVAGNVETFLRSSMKEWKTVLTSMGTELGEVQIKRGIFQGDSLSPLLFVIAMIPLSILLKKENTGYKFGADGKMVNHLLFMDDLKLYGRSKRDLDALIDLVRVFSRDIGMEFGLEKCAIVNIRRGVKEEVGGIELPDGQMMKEIDEDGYKYLGVLEGADVMVKEMKEKVRKEYLRRVKLVAKSRLYGRNLISAINAWAIGVVRYTAGVLDWTERELKAMDVKTRKFLAMFGVFHMKSSVDRLYMKRKDGGRGLISVFDCVECESKSLKEYVRGSLEWMLKVVAEDVGVDESKEEYQDRIKVEREERLRGKKLHGKFFEDVKDVADKRSWQWIRSGSVVKSSEGFVFAAQEQALRTRWLRSKIEGEKVDPNCRVCGETVESVGHLASACGKLAQREYKRRHDRMGLRVYWELCRRYGLKCVDKWYEEVPDPIRRSEDGNIEVWWDNAVETTKRMDHNRPDVIIIDKVKKEWILVDFSVPWDKNIVLKEDEKINNYSPLAHEIRKLHKVKTKIVPIVVGSLGVVSKNLTGYIKQLDIPDVLGCLQTSAILGTTIILRKILSL